MYGYLKGNITELSENTVTLETGGIGYELAVSTQTLFRLRLGDAVKLFSYMAVREDGVSLYGFLDKPEKNMFLRLIAVSGIGAKVALAVLSGLNTQKLAEAVAVNNITVLSSIKGIGKKTAERIILELKDKIVEEFGDISGHVLFGSAQGQAENEAILALVSLGYNKAEAAAAVAKVANTDKLSVEELILSALKG